MKVIHRSRLTSFYPSTTTTTTTAKSNDESEALSAGEAKIGTAEALAADKAYETTDSALSLAADKAYEAIDTLTYFPGLKAVNLCLTLASPV